MNQIQCCNGLEQWLSPKLFKALGDPTRVAVLVRLAEARTELTVSQVAACCPTHFSVVSRHLGILRDAGIVAATKRGKEVFYKVRVHDFAQALRSLADALELCCPEDEKLHSTSTHQTIEEKTI
jgi:ArsR family transcriptional regulator